MSPQIAKQQFRNQTGGYIGAVVIGPKGEEGGVAVEPGGTVWLSEPEQILTANAPRDAKDNPFIEQTAIRVNAETGAQEEYQVTPLVAISEQRFVPASERPVPADIPGALDQAIAQDAATGAEPVVPVTEHHDADTRHEEVTELGEEAKPGDLPPVPSRAAVAAEAAQPEPAPPEEPAPAPVPPEAPAEAPSEPQAPEPPQEPTPGVMGPPAPPQPPQAPEPEQPPAAPEETAAQVDPAIGEETGQAQSPGQPAPEGEFAKHEEVGQPDAPQTGSQEQPAPFTPPQE